MDLSLRFNSKHSRDIRVVSLLSPLELLSWRHCLQVRGLDMYGCMNELDQFLQTS